MGASLLRRGLPIVCPPRREHTACSFLALESSCCVILCKRVWEQGKRNTVLLRLGALGSTPTFSPHVTLLALHHGVYVTPDTVPRWRALPSRTSWHADALPCGSHSIPAARYTRRLAGDSTLRRGGETAQQTYKQAWLCADFGTAVNAWVSSDAIG
jgi:hypothetical protein